MFLYIAGEMFHTIIFFSCFSSDSAHVVYAMIAFLKSKSPRPPPFRSTSTPALKDGSHLISLFSNILISAGPENPIWNCIIHGAWLAKFPFHVGNVLQNWNPCEPGWVGLNLAEMHSCAIEWNGGVDALLFVIFGWRRTGLVARFGWF